MAKNKHLTNEERSQLEHLLRERRSIKAIARILEKSPSTISRETKNTQYQATSQLQAAFATDAFTEEVVRSFIFV